MTEWVSAVSRLKWARLHGPQEDDIAVMWEAAAEIEILRAALKEILDLSESRLDEVHQIARAALGQGREEGK